MEYFFTYEMDGPMKMFCKEYYDDWISIMMIQYVYVVSSTLRAETVLQTLYSWDILIRTIHKSLMPAKIAEIEITVGHIYEGGSYVNELAIDWFLQQDEETTELQDRWLRALPQRYYLRLFWPLHCTLRKA